MRRPLLLLWCAACSCFVPPAAIEPPAAAEAAPPRTDEQGHRLAYDFGILHRWFPLRWSGTTIPVTGNDSGLTRASVRLRCKDERCGRAPELEPLDAREPDIGLVLRATIDDGDGRLVLLIQNTSYAPKMIPSYYRTLLVLQQARLEGRFVEIEAVMRMCSTGLVSEQRLAARSQWRFEPPRYLGPIVTQMRFCMPLGERGRLCSNTFWGGVPTWQQDLGELLSIYLPDRSDRSLSDPRVERLADR
ncbi:MAG: hypothetical protein KC503_02145 [Myxococcales bacterium]|nr:hypothetical protein [Myxococcales bacterium]